MSKHAKKKIGVPFERLLNCQDPPGYDFAEKANRLSPWNRLSVPYSGLPLFSFIKLGFRNR